MTSTLKRLTVGLLAAAAVTAAAAGASQAADMKSWQRQIAKAVASKQVYPRSAMRREQEGEARVKITIHRSGEIADFEILQKTGHVSLDREVPKLIERINPLPAPPAEAGDEALTFILPLAWVLQ